jgi:phytoene/squalene synthetase
MTLYDETCFECSKLITNKYSTSFSQGINAFDQRYQYPIYAIYGFVRYADEIVDTFHEFDKELLIKNFRKDTYDAVETGISLNPVLQSFQLVVNQFGIENKLIDSFLDSMEMDLEKKDYDYDTYKRYIYGSAEVVGLMCLRVFCENDTALYQKLLPGACSFGAALQKINFLRDVKADFEQRGRTYFPGVDFSNFTEEAKKEVELDILNDLENGYESIKQLPEGARLGVYIAYKYYNRLFMKITNTSACKIMEKRIRVPDLQKVTLYYRAIVKQKLRLI